MNWDLYAADFPHGTQEGYRQGCRGGSCPAGVEHGLSCRVANQKASGDFQYRKLHAAGMTPAEIAVAMSTRPERHEPPARKVVELDDELDQVGDVLLDEPIRGEDPIMSTTVEAPSPASIVKNPKPEAPAPVEAVEGDAKLSGNSIRIWAREHGIQVGDRGILPKRIVAAYEADDPTLAAPLPPAPKPAVKAKALAKPKKPRVVEVSPAYRDELQALADEADRVLAERLELDEHFVDRALNDLEVEYLQAERDTAQAALAFALESWGKERDRADRLQRKVTVAHRLLMLVIDQRSELIRTVRQQRIARRTDADLIKILDAQVAALTGQNESLQVENERLRAPWWQRRAS